MDQIITAIEQLNDARGSSRQEIKNLIKLSDDEFNLALKEGIERRVFTQPKGPSGPVKLSKKPSS